MPMHGSSDLNSLSSASPDLSNGPPPLPPHNYANMPINKNPLPPPRQDEPRKFRRFEPEPEPLGYNDTQTLRADQRLDYPPPPPPKDSEPAYTNGVDSLDNGGHNRPQFRQLHVDYDAKSRAEPQQATRVPSGHARRDNRASLRAKHRKDLEEAALRVSS